MKLKAFILNKKYKRLIRDENEVYLSYGAELKDQVKNLSTKLDSFYKLTSYTETITSQQNENDQYLNEKARFIRKSKVFMCFLTIDYVQSIDFQKEIRYASNFNKKILILIIDKIAIDNQKYFYVNFNIVLRDFVCIDCHEYKNRLSWYDDEHIIGLIKQSIESNLINVFIFSYRIL